MPEIPINAFMTSMLTRENASMALIDFSTEALSFKFEAAVLTSSSDFWYCSTSDMDVVFSNMIPSSMAFH